MGITKTESMDYQCEKLGGFAHINAEYYYGKDFRLLSGFDCDRAKDCGISRSPFSGSFNFTADCPLYNVLAKNMN